MVEKKTLDYCIKKIITNCRHIELEKNMLLKKHDYNKKTPETIMSEDPLTMGYFDNLDNESLNKYKKKS
jgi:hypothetical protein